jgi:hypothetical protein
MMKRISTAMISILLACGGVALAQTYSQSAPPPTSQQAPPADSPQAPSDNSSSSSSSGSSSMSMSQKHEAMKECVAQQQANNSGMSKKDAKKACKAQLKSQE